MIQHEINSYRSLQDKERESGENPFFDPPLMSVLVSPFGLEREIGFDHPKRKEEATLRQELSQMFRRVFEKFQGQTVDVGILIEQQLLDENELFNLYEKLQQLFLLDGNNRRLLLYLPFEILLPVEQQNLLSEKNRTKFTDFCKTIHTAWIELLAEKDPRENFTQGDINESDPENVTWVIKAAHLAPFLIEKGYLQKESVLSISQDPNNPLLLQQSLQEALLVDLHVWDAPLSIQPVSLETKTLVQNILDNSLETIQDNSPQKSYEENAWNKWLNKQKRQNVVRQNQELLAQKIAYSDESTPIVTQLLHQESSSSPRLIETVFIAGKLLSQKEKAQALRFVELVLPELEFLWKQAPLPLQNSIWKGLCQWHSLQLIDSNTLHSLGISVPDLSQAIPQKLEETLQPTLTLIEEALQLLPHTELANLIEPFFLISGSLVKGYGDMESDSDVIAFLKPEASWEQRNEICQKLNEFSQTHFNQPHMLAFWTGEDAEGPFLRYYPEEGRQALNASHIHTLLGGCWVGESAKMQSLQNNLLRRYCDLSRFGKNAENTRFSLLGLLERDALQTRLLQGGYSRFHADQRPPKPTNSENIDWESSFWDPGYRQTATLLFLERVFLPNLSA